MVRVTNSTISHARHAKVRKATKGYRGKNHSTFRLAKQAQMKAGLHAYVGRKRKKRDFRRLWITRISGALRNAGLRYSEIKNKWLHAKMEVDRKNLAELAVEYPKVFEKIVSIATKQK
jgi:large subunit ribosomal protein L20